MAPPRTIKLVIIGESGVGKTSLRGQFVSGRFTSGYRATIGADFVSKTVPHPHKPDEEISLQIWDTAGQERFSSLSSAFFRGADAVLLVFDAARPETLASLPTWWQSFAQHAPVSDALAPEFPVLVVGAKTDLGRAVSEADAAALVDALIPPGPEDAGLDLFLRPAPAHALTNGHADPTAAAPNGDAHAYPPPALEGPPSPSASSLSFFSARSASPTPTGSIAIRARRPLSRSRSRSSALVGTMRTGLTVFHTPSSSMGTGAGSGWAAHSRAPSAAPSTRPTSPAPSVSASPFGTLARGHAHAPRRMASLAESLASSGGATIMPAGAHRRRASSLSSIAAPPAHTQTELPPRPLRRPRIAFTSAQTGDGVCAVFEHVAARVAHAWAYYDAIDARRMSVRESDSDGLVRIGEERRGRTRGGCC